MSRTAVFSVPVHDNRQEVRQDNKARGEEGKCYRLRYKMKTCGLGSEKLQGRKSEGLSITGSPFTTSGREEPYKALPL
jgi:hypothetical protein